MYRNSTVNGFASSRTFVMPALCIAIIALLGCARTPLYVGFIGPMTGPTANIGVEGYRGFSLAIAEINAEGGALGRPLQPVMLDDAADPGLCLEAARELIGKGITIIVLHTTSGAAAGALPYLLEQDALVLTRTVSDPSWVGFDDSFLRFVGSTELFGSTLGGFARAMGKQNLGIIIDQRNSSYADSMTRGLLAAAPELSLMGERRVGQAMAHDELAAWALELGSDAVFAVLAGLDAAKLAQALERVGFTGQLYLSPWSQDQNLLAYAGRLASRIFLPSTFNPDDNNPRYLVFKEKHRELYAEAPVMSGVFGYEIGRFLAQGINRARSDRPGAVKAAIVAISRFEGLQYAFSLDSNGDAAMEALVITIRNGAYAPARALP
ncbi:MAG TPA: hypothetical protein DCG47_10080 [Spirochaetaceae bacterium]|jgi:branched-chain amino acid transport system substrate-binding protein|nr:hypothetical protein [Spirochaetaceae bacterium]